MSYLFQVPMAIPRHAGRTDSGADLATGFHQLNPGLHTRVIVHALHQTLDPSLGKCLVLHLALSSGERYVSLNLIHRLEKCLFQIDVVQVG